MFQFYLWASAAMQIVMYAIVFITFVYMLRRYRNDMLSVLLVVMFFPGLFAFLGTSIQNLYKIFVLGYTVWVAFKSNSLRVKSNNDILWVTAFTLFTLIFFISTGQSSGNTITIVFSQFSRYLEVFLLYFIIKIYVYRQRHTEILRLLYELFLIQILVSVVKLVLFQGQQIESLVGTMSHIGGAMGTTIPLLGFIVLWLYRKGDFNKWDWLYVIGLLLVGFTTGKRAIWFLLPVVILSFMVYVRGVKLNKYLIATIFAVPFVFYLGIRLTPTLNPEKRVWGSFDPEYAFNYAETYQFGKEREESIPFVTYSDQVAQGRGGATLALVDLLLSDQQLSTHDIWGMGFSSMYSTDYVEFSNLPLTIKISHKGSATGLFQTYTTMGYMGILATLVFCFLPILFLLHKRIAFAMIALVAWEYFMYTGIIFRTPAFAAVILFLVFYSNVLILQKRKEV